MPFVRNCSIVDGVWIVAALRLQVMVICNGMNLSCKQADEYSPNPAQTPKHKPKPDLNPKSDLKPKAGPKRSGS